MLMDMVEEREVPLNQHLVKLETSIKKLENIKETIKDKILLKYDKIKFLINKKDSVH